MVDKMVEVLVRIPKKDFEELQSNYVWWGKHGEYIKKGTVIPKGHGRKFEEIVVEYPPADLCTYPEYKGKPYFSIKYEENGEHIIGFGTYNPEVFSRYLREYFIMPAIIEADEEDDTNGND